MPITRSARDEPALCAIARLATFTRWGQRGGSLSIRECGRGPRRRGLPHREIAATELHLDGCAACREIVAHALRALAVQPALTELPRIGRCRLLREVGAGSMGRVYAAEDPELGRGDRAQGPAPGGARRGARRRARWRREARAMARLTHPNVIVVHEIGAADEQLFIAMELVKGESLRRWLDAAPRGWRAVADDPVRRRARPGGGARGGRGPPRLQAR